MAHRTKSEVVRTRRPAYYWWILANVVAACLAVLSWLVCLNVFLHPEIPRNYEILKYLGQAQVPEDLAETDAPRGEAADPRALYRRYAELPQEDLDRLNSALMKNYLTRLKEIRLVQYVEGDYKVEAVRSLTKDDLFFPGFAVRARAMVRPDEFSNPAPWPVVIEYLFPTEEEEAVHWILPEDRLEVTKFPNCAMVLHVSRLKAGEDTPVVCLTVTPAAFGDYTVGGERKFRLTAPKELNPGAPMPVFGVPADS